MASPIDERGEVGSEELNLPDDLKKEVKTWGADDIRFVLPNHRGWKLLLDRVESWPNNRVVGRLCVAPDRCVGFCFLNGEELALTGADLIEMAAQLLGVFGYHFKEVFAERHRRFVLASVGKAAFHAPVKAGETVEMVINAKDISIRTMGKPPSQRFVVSGREFVIKVGQEVRGSISDVMLMSTLKVKK